MRTRKFTIPCLPLILGIGLCSSQAYAEPVQNFTNTSSVHLDQSQNIFFEQFSENTFSLQLLQNKNKFNVNDIILGGSAELDWQNWHGDPIEESPVGSVYQNSHGLFFTQATADIMANTSSWSAVFVSLADSTMGRNDSSANNIAASRAFAVLGDLNKTPFYATAGLNNIPFGVFSGAGPWDTPLTESYFNPSAGNQVSLGFYKDGFNGAVTGFNDNVNHQNNEAYALYYNKSYNVWGYSLGLGYLSDMKTNNASTYVGGSQASRSIPSVNVGNLGAVWDMNSSIYYRQLTLNGEYVEGRKKVTENQTTPWAYSLATNYVQSIAGKDTTFGVSRSVTAHLKDVATPLTGYDNLVSTFTGLQSAWAFNVSRPFNKNFIWGVDFQRAVTNTGFILNVPQKHTYTTTFDLMAYL